MPKLSVSKIVQTIKGNLSRQIFLRFPEIKKDLWGGEFWTDGYYVNTVSQYGGKEQIKRYIQNQGKNYKNSYKRIFRDDAKSQDLFDSLSN